jgi:hypothetical protein
MNLGFDNNELRALITNGLYLELFYNYFSKEFEKIDKDIQNRATEMIASLDDSTIRKIAGIKFERVVKFSRNKRADDFLDIFEELDLFKHIKEVINIE